VDAVDAFEIEAIKRDMADEFLRSGTGTGMGMLPSQQVKLKAHMQNQKEKKNNRDIHDKNNWLSVV